MQVDELVIAALASLPVSAWVFYGIQLQGSWGIFWLVYFLVSTAKPADCADHFTIDQS